MIISKSWIGIDVSKHYLDVFDDGAGRWRRSANDSDGVAVLLEEISGRDVHVIFEATGAYDRMLGLALARAGVSFSRINPSRARAFARAAGFLAKTDKVDARMLAALGRALPLRAEPAPDEARDRLKALHKRRDQLVGMRQQERTRRAEMRDRGLKAELDHHLAFLDAAIAEIEKAIDALIRSTKALAEDRRLMCTVPGIGPVNATTLAALMPELGARTPKALAALAGLAPLNADSGLHRGLRRIRDGRRRVRQALYMAAVTAARSRSRFGQFYRKLRAAGKPPKVALIALARKLLVTINAILRTRTPFHA
jgi:transposase